MSNDALTCFCTILGVVVYAMALAMWINSGLRDELSKEKAKTYCLELDVKYMKQDIKRLEDRRWELGK